MDSFTAPCLSPLHPEPQTLNPKPKSGRQCKRTSSAKSTAFWASAPPVSLSNPDLQLKPESCPKGPSPKGTPKKGLGSPLQDSLKCAAASISRQLFFAAEDVDCGDLWKVSYLSFTFVKPRVPRATVALE